MVLVNDSFKQTEKYKKLFLFKRFEVFFQASANMFFLNYRGLGE